MCLGLSLCLIVGVMVRSIARLGLFLSLLAPMIAGAQTTPSYPIFENDKLSPEIYRARRQEIKNQLGNNGVAIVLTNPERNRTNDTDFRFRPDSNFWYLTGFEEPDSLLVLAPGGIRIDGRKVTELLLVNESDQMSETWLGYRMGPDNVSRLLGIEMALPNARLKDVLAAIGQTPGATVARPLVPPDPSGPSLDMANQIAAWKKGMTANTLNVSSALAKLRVHKSPEELVLMRKATDASVMGHIQAMRSIKPGMREYEIQALVEYVFTRMGCESVAYNSIVGSGPNSTILHYEADRRLMQSGDLVCMDVAGEYHGYAADVTRTFPVSGKFTSEQRAIYEIVMNAQEAGIRECKAGASFGAAHNAAAKVLQEGLTKLGIITKPADLGLYFMHGTSHYVGLDVHDAHGDNTLHPGAVLTVEPGIYIKAGSPCDKKWWNIGVRIEDDILVTDSGPVNLSAGAPRRPEEIEALMKQDGIGNIPLKK